MKAPGAEHSRPSCPGAGAQSGWSGLPTHCSVLPQSTHQLLEPACIVAHALELLFQLGLHLGPNRCDPGLWGQRNRLGGSRAS